MSQRGHFYFGQLGHYHFGITVFFLKMFWEAMSLEDGKRTILLREAGTDVKEHLF